MKQVIALRYYQSNTGCDMLFNTAVHYGLQYTEYENQMLFFIREEIADERTAYFFGDLLCHIFNTTYSNNRYSYPKGSPDYEVGIYDICCVLLGFRKLQEHFHLHLQTESCIMIKKAGDRKCINLFRNVP